MKKFKLSLLFVLILAIAMLAAACGTAKFKIEFIVDGEVYATVNTNAQRYYYSATPIYDNAHWRFVGDVPTVWEV